MARKLGSWPLLILLSILTGGPILGQSNQINQVREPDLSAYPEVLIHLNSRNPKPIADDKIRVLVEKEEIKSAVSSSPADASGKSKDVLILWELPSYKARKGQNDYFRELLLAALPDLIEEGDRLNIATFAWTDLEGGTRTLKWLSDDWTDNPNDFTSKVEEAKPPGGKHVQENHGSEIYPAMLEGIDYLSKSQDQARILVVLSAEFANIYNANTEKSMVTARARQEGISVYNFRYRIKSPKYTLADVAKSTHGKSHELDKDSPVEEADILTQMMAGATARAQGIDYEISFQCPFGKDGKLHQLSILLDQENFPISYTPPSPSFKELVNNNPVLFAGIACGLLLIILASIFLYRKNKKKQQQRLIAQDQQLQEVQERGNKAEERLAAQSKALKDIKTQEAQQSEAAKRKAELEQLTQEMYAGNNSPRIVVHWADKTETFSLESPVTIIGRDEKAQIMIPHDSISRSHAQIVYQGGIYHILDLKSTNGTQVSGEKVTSIQLQHGSSFQLGDIQCSFYI